MDELWVVCGYIQKDGATINLELSNASARDAKLVLSFVTLRKYGDLNDLLRSPIVSPVPQPMSSIAKLAIFAKSYTLAKQKDDLATDSENNKRRQRRIQTSH